MGGCVDPARQAGQHGDRATGKLGPKLGRHLPAHLRCAPGTDDRDGCVVFVRTGAAPPPEENGGGAGIVGQSGRVALLPGHHSPGIGCGQTLSRAGHRVA
jgi:hypothetical protein